MVVLKILGGIDLMAAVIYLSLTFGIGVFPPLIIFGGGLLFVKGLFIFTGEVVLCGIDLIASVLLFLSLAFTIPAFLLWIPAFLLLAKGVVSFI